MIDDSITYRKPLDGLTNEEYRQRYEIATQNRALKNKFSPSEMLSMIMDLVSRPRSDTQNPAYVEALDEEAKREWFDLGDWMKFLHEQWYKPGWRIDLCPTEHYAHRNVLTLKLTAHFEAPAIPGGPYLSRSETLAVQHIVHAEWAHTEQEAERVLDGILEDAERQIALLWREKP